MSIVKDKISARDLVGGQRSVHSAIGAQCVTRGDWEFECLRPVHVLDPPKLRAILDKHGLRFRHEPTVLNELFIRSLYDRLPRLDFDEVESLLKGGGQKFFEAVRNKIVNQGLDSVNDVYLGAATQITTWYVGLISTPHVYAAGDTAAQIGGTNGWTETGAYSESVRQTWTPNGASSSQSVSNSSSRATFSINGTVTVNGGFLVSNSTKSGTSGKIYSEADLSVAKSVSSGDTLLITATFTQSSAT